MLKCIGCAAAASERPSRAIGCTRIATVPACARPGAASAASAARTTGSLGTITTLSADMRRLLTALFLLALALPGGAGAAPPRVLAIHFTQDVNPVTQDWLNHELGKAESGHYDAAVIVLDTPGGL